MEPENAAVGAARAGVAVPEGAEPPPKPFGSPAAPDIPTFAEQTLPNFSVDAWFAVIGPKGLPPAQVKKAHDAVVSAFNDPALYTRQVFDGYAHMDLFIGRDAARDVFPYLITQLERR